MDDVHSYKLYRKVNSSQWYLLLFVTSATFSISLAWVAAEIFRENVINVQNVKSDVEFYVEGLTVHIIALTWIVTVCIVTMPGGIASLIGNLYFTTWSSLISVVGTLIWFVRDWRQMILDVIEEQQNEYNHIKVTLREREEKRLTAMARNEQTGDDSEGERAEEFKTEEGDEVVLCNDDPDVDDDDITLSITSGWRGSFSVASSLPSSPDKTKPAATISLASGWHGPASVTASCRTPLDETMPTVTGNSSLFMSALSFFYSDTGDPPIAENAGDN